MGYNTNEERLLASLDRQARLGECGAILIDDAVAHTGHFVAITALAASTTLHADTVSNITDFTTMEIPQGATVFGIFTSVKLGGGKVIAYTRCE